MCRRTKMESCTRTLLFVLLLAHSTGVRLSSGFVLEQPAPLCCTRRARRTRSRKFPSPRGAGIHRRHYSCPRASTANKRKSTVRHLSDQDSDNSDAADLNDVRRIYAISDLHTDHTDNMSWLIDRCTCSSSSEAAATAATTPGPNDALIIAGDISHDLDIIESSLSTIVNNLGCHTFFIPGNHEAWVKGQKMDNMNLTCSFDKLRRVVDVCDNLGVHTTHKLIGKNHAHPAWIVPIWSWYDGTLALPDCEDLCQDFQRWPWVDFARCEWGEQYQGKVTSTTASAAAAAAETRFAIPGFERIPLGLTEHLLAWNEPSIDAVRDSYANWPSPAAVAGSSLSLPGLITYSHFLPAQNTLPDWKVPSSTFKRGEWLDHPVPEVSAKFAYVGGSELIDEQIRSIVPPSALRQSAASTAALPPHVHVFGHSHRPKDFYHDGIRYLHNPVGKPVEREMNMIDIEFDFQLIWDAAAAPSAESGGEVLPRETVIRYWEEKGGGVKLLAENMAKRRRDRRRRKLEARVK